MCGIAAFSAPEGSKLNARHLAHHLLTQIENRGSHASGFSYINPDGTVGIYKNPTPGSQLSLHELPRDAKTVILHTRYATQGPQSDNRNNHPVISTDRRIALVHNGVISNDARLRGELGIEERHGQVDSLVIPSLIAQQGVAGLSKLAGYAAIAWLDVEKPTELNIAKLKNSPVAYTSLFDGTFVMASTPALLEMALLGAGLQYGGVFELAEQKILTVVGGFIMNHDRSPAMSYDYGAYNRYSSATAGGHGSATGSATSRATGRPAPSASYPTKGSEDLKDKPKVVMPTADDETVDVDAYLADLEEWRRNRAKADERDKGIAMAMLTGPSDNWTDQEWDDYIAQLEERDGKDYGSSKSASAQEHESCTVSYNTENPQGFYILDMEGDISHYPDLEDMETQLRWYAQMSRTDMDLFTVEDDVNWCNHVMDLGHIEDDGELVSWVDDTAEIDEWESPAVRNLQFVREGAQHLSMLKGA